MTSSHDDPVFLPIGTPVPGTRVHVLDRTMSLAAINVTGPFAGELLRRLGLAEPPRFLSHVRADVAGIPCDVMRLSFTGEAA